MSAKSVAACHRLDYIGGTYHVMTGLDLRSTIIPRFLAHTSSHRFCLVSQVLERGYVACCSGRDLVRHVVWRDGAGRGALVLPCCCAPAVVVPCFRLYSVTVLGDMETVSSLVVRIELGS